MKSMLKTIYNLPSEGRIDGLILRRCYANTPNIDATKACIAHWKKQPVADRWVAIKMNKIGGGAVLG
eukprot:CAMPEP_0117054810 /NCGR_PEP_ID=MMETSP0472-20121206/37983_1 /TAXON_ID=693140 ORGANISM="Tiarina fusus, Strain LIS" /NCGR_SAMPLE_ID=MMETSP0472 /ASSEMBLY_ACC=CAM_ASM_000603 /LENGTH=66 /DNA_ID=CAMNT_0004770537 /DNA_START=7 /DNA_END=207 /DNA_ORIENTATION=-